MKKTIIILAAVFAAITHEASAQPRAAGIRLGATGFEASYQHSIAKNFIEADMGIDFGLGGTGFKATGIYNFMLARPAWTDRGSWGIYAGPGISMGYVSDRVTVSELILDEDHHFNRRVHYADYGFMFSFTGQIGLEYTFWFPLQLSVDIRPYLGFHVSDRYYMNSSRTGFYNWGLYGFVPTVSARYRF